MQNFDQLLGSSGMDLGQLGARFGLTPEQTRSALGSLMPAVLGGFHKQADPVDPGSFANGAGTAEPTTSTGNSGLSGGPGGMFGGGGNPLDAILNGLRR